MTQKQKIAELINIAELLTKRVKQIEEDALLQRKIFLDLGKKLELRIMELESKK